MRKPFTMIGAILLLLIAAMNVYRTYSGMDLTVSGQAVPMMVNYVTAAIFAIVGLLTLTEIRK